MNILSCQHSVANYQQSFKSLECPPELKEEKMMCLCPCRAEEYSILLLFNVFECSCKYDVVKAFRYWKSEKMWDSMLCFQEASFHQVAHDDLISILAVKICLKLSSKGLVLNL